MGFSYSQLRAADLADLIATAQSDEHDDSPAMNEIIRRFDRKVRQIAVAVSFRPADHDDVGNAARLALVRAVRRHRADRTGFTTYATIFMTGAARREWKRLASFPETCLPGPDLVYVADRTPVTLSLGAEVLAEQRGWGTGRVGTVIAGLPQRQRALLAERYVFDLELSKIARLHGTSVSAVSQRLKTAHQNVLAILRPTATHATAA